MGRKGFTLIELLVVIVIIGILVSIALPNFIKVKIKAREAEAKQNLHAIQLGVERYATDNEGVYPYFLYGGDTYFNIGTTKWNFTGGIQGYLCPGPQGRHPFDMFNIDYPEAEAHTYPSTGLNRSNAGTEGQEFGDVLVYEGYISKYPTNPFTTIRARVIYGEEAYNWGNYIPWRACGGRDGRSMFNIGWAGEVPTLMAYDFDGEPNDSIKFEFPGQFYYHPRFSDGATNADHFVALWDLLSSQDSSFDDPWGDAYPRACGARLRTQDVWTTDVYGYDLLAYGDPSTDGMDIDWWLNPPVTTKQYAKRTGYLNNTDEPNPYDPNRAPRTEQDGVPDYYILHLSSSQDAKPHGIG